MPSTVQLERASVHFKISIQESIDHELKADGFDIKLGGAIFKFDVFEGFDLFSSTRGRKNASTLKDGGCLRYIVANVKNRFKECSLAALQQVRMSSMNAANSIRND